MNRIALVTLAAATLVVGACGNADAPSEPIAATSVPSTISPPRTPAPEVALPPLPSNITAEPEAAPKARDTPENEPKDALTKTEESNEMPKALHGNNHSSTALDREPGK